MLSLLLPAIIYASTHREMYWDGLILGVRREQSDGRRVD
jgi:hypothetical protein